MEQQQGSDFLATKRIAIVTGSNKGIGLEICRQLASKGIKVILTARDVKRGLEALEKLAKESDLCERHVVFHQLDVTDSASIASLAEFIKTKFGKLDILINNAAITGVTLDAEAFSKAVELAGNWPFEASNWKEMSTQPYEMAEECLKTNYYGTKSMIEELLPLLQLSDSARIVNVSSTLGLLQLLPSEWAKQVLGEENLTEERIDEVVAEVLKDLKGMTLEKKEWPAHFSAYKLSKAAMNAYTRVLAKKLPSGISLNSVCPGFVPTDMTCNSGLLTVPEGAQKVVNLALLPSLELSGHFFINGQVSPS